MDNTWFDTPPMAAGSECGVQKQRMYQRDTRQSMQSEDLRGGASSGCIKPPTIAMPAVVIVGRPNVGKSTLFNRLCGCRMAITSPKSGTTRDGAHASADFLGRTAALVDTGGFRLSAEPRYSATAENDAAIDLAVRHRAMNEAKKACVVILVLEAAVPTAEDEEIILALRPFMDKTIVVVNKTEGGRNISDSYEWARFGFDNMIFISAEHGDNIEELKEAVARKLPVDAQNVNDQNVDAQNVASQNVTAPAESIRLALVGKPNVGKSTLLNRLTHSDLAMVSPIAGTTRDSVSGAFRFEGSDFTVTDTAGIRRKARVTDDIEYYSVNRAIKALDGCDIAIIMVDSQEGVSEQDKKICDRALDAGCAVIFTLSKWDLKSKGRRAAKDAAEEVHRVFPQMAHCPVVHISALQGTGMIELLRTSISIKAMLMRRVETSALNIALRDWVTHRPPPAAKSRKFRPRYITQVGVNPPRFVLFARDAHDVPKTYLTYLKNSIRRDMGFEQVPVVLEVRESNTNQAKLT